MPLFGTKHLDNLPLRVIRYHLRLDQFDFSMVLVPGKHLYTADALCRSPSTMIDGDLNLEMLAELSMESHNAHLPASTEQLETYHKAQKSEPTCLLLKKYCHEGWSKQVHEMAKHFSASAA